MALPDYFTVSQGTPIIWGEFGASGVTNTLSLDALASTQARMGASVDLGANWNRTYLVQIIIETGTAPTAATTVDVYLACSRDNSTWPGGVTGSDAAYKTGEEAEWAKQLGGMATQLVATNDGNTTQVQQPRLWTPKGRYVAPVVHNQLGQAVRDQATNSNNTSRLVLVPLNDVIQDSAP